MTHGATVDAIADLAEEQGGLFTRRQAEATGMAWTTVARLASGGVAERVAHGVYRLRGTPPDDHVELRAAWLQLAPDTPAWERTVEQGVVSRRSAAALYGLGHLPADVHNFTLPVRRQSRRPDVRIHRGDVGTLWIRLRGMLVTRPALVVADLLAEREDPEAVAQVAADALRAVHDHPGNVAETVAPHAKSFGLPQGDGYALLEWLLDLTEDPERGTWLAEARAEERRGDF